MRDPIVIDPLGFDPRTGWQECREYIDQCGGLAHEDGSPNWRAAFGADPGCMSCPNCGEMYWAWGRVAECLDCHFRFPTDWWAAYSWGVQQKNREVNPPPAMRDDSAFRSYRVERRDAALLHPYYRYGYENPVEDAWKERDQIPWKDAVGSIDKYPEGARIHG